LWPLRVFWAWAGGPLEDRRTPRTKLKRRDSFYQPGEKKWKHSLFT
jgi:hypothetical protein